MKNCLDFQDYIKKYFDQEIKKFDTFKVWRDLLVALRRNHRSSVAHAMFNKFGKALTVTMMMVDVRATEDGWTPTLMVSFDWDAGEQIISLQLTIARDEVLFASISNMRDAVESLGDDFDYIEAFEKTVVIMNALRQS